MRVGHEFDAAKGLVALELLELLVEVEEIVALVFDVQIGRDDKPARARPGPGRPRLAAGRSARR
jgi:hypothetical protein